MRRVVLSLNEDELNFLLTRINPIVTSEPLLHERARQELIAKFRSARSQMERMTTEKKKVFSLETLLKRPA